MIFSTCSIKYSEVFNCCVTNSGTVFSRNENNAMQEEIISLKKVRQFQEFAFLYSFSKTIVIDFVMLEIRAKFYPLSSFSIIY